MALNPDTLASGLEAMEPTDNEADAINALGDAFEAYMEGSAAGPVPAVPGSFAGAKAAMKGALVGVSNDGAGAALLASAITTFWGTAGGAAASIYPPATAITPPPGLAGLQAALEAVFAANTSGSLSLADSAQSVAAAIHGTQPGGIAVFPAPPAGIGPQTIV